MAFDIASLFGQTPDPMATTQEIQDQVLSNKSNEEILAGLLNGAGIPVGIQATPTIKSETSPTPVSALDISTQLDALAAKKIPATSMTGNNPKDFAANVQGAAVVREQASQFALQAASPLTKFLAGESKELAGALAEASASLADMKGVTTAYYSAREQEQARVIESINPNDAYAARAVQDQAAGQLRIEQQKLLDVRNKLTASTSFMEKLSLVAQESVIQRRIKTLEVADVSATQATARVDQSLANSEIVVNAATAQKATAMRQAQDMAKLALDQANLKGQSIETAQRLLSAVRDISNIHRQIADDKMSAADGNLKLQQFKFMEEDQRMARQRLAMEQERFNWQRQEYNRQETLYKDWADLGKQVGMDITNPLNLTSLPANDPRRLLVQQWVVNKQGAVGPDPEAAVVLLDGAFGTRGAESIAPAAKPIRITLQTSELKAAQTWEKQNPGKKFASLSPKVQQQIVLSSLGTELGIQRQNADYDAANNAYARPKLGSLLATYTTPQGTVQTASTLSPQLRSTLQKIANENPNFDSLPMADAAYAIYKRLPANLDSATRAKLVVEAGQAMVKFNNDSMGYSKLALPEQENLVGRAVVRTPGMFGGEGTYAPSKEGYTFDMTNFASTKAALAVRERAELQQQQRAAIDARAVSDRFTNDGYGTFGNPQVGLTR